MKIKYLLLIPLITVISCGYSDQMQGEKYYINELDINFDSGAFYCFINKISNNNNRVIIEIDPVEYYIGEEAMAMAILTGHGEYIIDQNGDSLYAFNSNYFILNEFKDLKYFEVTEKTLIQLNTLDFEEQQLDEVSLQQFKKIKRFGHQLYRIEVENGKVSILTEIKTEDF